MYLSRMLSVGKAENGFVVSCDVPIKPDKKAEGKSMVDAYPGSCEKNYLAKNEVEVVAIIGKLMPLLDTDFKTEDEFDMAFDKAAGEPEEKD